MTLREDGSTLLVGRNAPCRTDGRQEGPGFEGGALLARLNTASFRFRHRNRANYLTRALDVFSSEQRAWCAFDTVSRATTTEARFPGLVDDPLTSRTQR